MKLITNSFRSDKGISTSVGVGSRVGVGRNHTGARASHSLAGQGGGKFKSGQVIDVKNRNNNDLLISCQQAAGITSNTLGLSSLCAGPILPTV